MKQKNVVVIGGGTGSFTLLTGLKKHDVSLTALVTMSDDGGSTGILRDEYGVLPPGDVRQCIVALSDSQRLRDLFSYRFESGTFKGHSFGNVFLSTAEKMTGSFEEAVQMASDVLHISGRVVPITTTNTQLVMQQPNGETVIGEYKIAHSRMDSRPQLELKPAAKITSSAARAIAEADVIVIAPGNLYGSLAPALLVEGVREALVQSNATVAYVCNLVTKPKQTDGFMVHDYADEIERFSGSSRLDVVVYNTDEPAPSLLRKYTHDGEYIVDFDLEEMHKRHYKAIGLPLIDAEPVVSRQGDPIGHARTLIRHNADALSHVLLGLDK